MRYHLFLMSLAVRPGKSFSSEAHARPHVSTSSTSRLRSARLMGVSVTITPVMVMGFVGRSIRSQATSAAGTGKEWGTGVRG